MPTFEYKAKKQNAETVLGKIIAENKEEAVDKINQLGLIPVSIDDANPVAKKGITVQSVRVPVKTLYLFTQQLVNLLKAGVSILRSFEIIAAQMKNKYFRHIVQSIYYGIQEGRAFSDCLRDYPQIFSPLYVTMVNVGEESGRLYESLSSIAQHLKSQNEFFSKVRTAIAYPILMFVFGVGTIFFILTYVMPQITSLFDNLNQGLPAPTIIVMKLSSLIIDWGLLVLILAIMGSITLNRWFQSPKGKLAKSRLIVSVPFFRDFLLKVELVRFCRTLELLLKSGISIVRAIQISIPVIKNELLKEEMLKCQDELIAGRSFGEGLRQTQLVPEIMGNLISVGEESGSLEGTLKDIADTYEQETNESIKVMTSLLEPVMIIVVGGIVGFIVVSMLLPIFQLDFFAS